MVRFPPLSAGTMAHVQMAESPLAIRRKSNGTAPGDRGRDRKKLPLLPPKHGNMGCGHQPIDACSCTKKLTTATAPVQLVLADVESLPFEDNSFDTVIATFVFCNVPNPIQGFREIRRVLKPNGIAYFLEHMIPMTPRKARFFDRLDPWVYKAIGDHINRRTDQNVELAGMSIQKIIPLTSDGVVRLIIARPNKGGIS